MDAPHTPAAAERGAFPEAAFLDWLQEPGTPAIISKEHGRYYAYCYRFGLAGTGRSQQEAVRDAQQLLTRYLIGAFSEGCPYKRAKKAPPVSVRAQITYLRVRTVFLKSIKPLSRVGQLVSVPTASRNEAHPIAH
jgi:hypothetical protein